MISYQLKTLRTEWHLDVILLCIEPLCLMLVDEPVYNNTNVYDTTIDAMLLKNVI